MRQSNDVDDAMNDVVMVIIHQQKKEWFYAIYILYIFMFIFY